MKNCNMKYKIITLLSAFFFLSILLAGFVSAHCPLCTAGAGAAAVGAAWFGVDKAIIGLFIGAFAMSMGMWFSRIIKKQYINNQKTLIIGLVFLATLLPLLPVFSSIQGFYLGISGEYGSWLNRTYAINASLLTSLIGGIIVFISPSLNNLIKKIIGNSMPFQGIILTFSFLLIAALIIQFVS